MTAKYNFFNTIAFVIIVDSLHNNFEIITASMFEVENKTIKEI